MSVSEENPIFFYYPEEDNVLGQHEKRLNGTNTEEIRARRHRKLFQLLSNNK